MSEDPRYWFLSPAADAAIDKALEADPRRRWDPRNDRPSLASLQGKAKNYGGRYAASRAGLLRTAGVVVRSAYYGRHRRLVYVVTVPGERLTASEAPADVLAAVGPRWVHDCESCTFEGRDGAYDLYSCRDTLIARYGSDGEDYTSYPREVLRQINPLTATQAVTVLRSLMFRLEREAT